MFTVSRKLTAVGNIYGLSSLSDSHMSKDSEWGVVAYLAQSKYGKYGNNNYSSSNKEVYMNNYGENTYFTALTGCSSGSPLSNYYGASCTYTYDKNISGTGASTTGTIYGVYDMVGGDWEGTMGNFGNVINASGFLSMPESKYYDLYTDTNMETACGGVICYGLAASETIRWYADRASFPTSSNSWSLRGGSYNNGSDSGIFSFHPFSGTANLGNTFRVSLTP